MGIGKRLLGLALAALLLGAGCGESGGDNTLATGTLVTPVGSAAPVARTAYSEEELAADPSVRLGVGQMAVLTPETTQLLKGDLGVVGSDAFSIRLAKPTKLILRVDSPYVESVSLTQNYTEIFSQASPGENQRSVAAGDYNLVIKARKPQLVAQQAPSVDVQVDDAETDRPPAIFVLNSAVAPEGVAIFDVSGRPGAFSFENCNLNSLVFRLADFRGATFRNANLENTLFITCQLQQALFESCQVPYTRFRFSDLTDATMKECTGYSPNLGESANLFRTKFERCNFAYPEFSEGKLDRASFVDCDLSGIVCIETLFLGCTFTRCQFGQAYFIANQMESCTLSDIITSGNPDFSETQWRGSVLDRFVGKFGNFTRGVFVGNEVRNSNFASASFRRANFAATSFADTIFFKANFSEAAGFDGIGFINADLSLATAPNGTVFPDGTIK